MKVACRRARNWSRLEQMVFTWFSPRENHTSGLFPGGVIARAALNARDRVVG
jgi:hypothetical protein